MRSPRTHGWPPQTAGSTVILEIGEPTTRNATASVARRQPAVGRDVMARAERNPQEDAKTVRGSSSERGARVWDGRRRLPEYGQRPHADSVFFDHDDRAGIECIGDSGQVGNDQCRLRFGPPATRAASSGADPSPRSQTCTVSWPSARSRSATIGERALSTRNLTRRASAAARVRGRLRRRNGAPRQRPRIRGLGRPRRFPSRSYRLPPSRRRLRPGSGARGRTACRGAAG